MSNCRNMNNFLKKLFNFIKKHANWPGALLVLLTAFFFRNSIVERDLRTLERATGSNFAPFLVESAVMYSYINNCADNKDIAAPDPALPGMKDVKVSEQMTLSLEYAGGWLLKIRRYFYGTPEPGIYEHSYEESRFLRKCFTWYLALAPMFIFLMLRWMRVPFFYALCGALIQIFSAAALGRYTGQDLLKGAFAWPLLTAYLACYAASLHGRFRARKLALIGAMLTSAAAVAGWDASQMLIGVLALADIINAVIFRRANFKYRNFYLATFIAVTLTTLTLPYCRAHGSFFSPVMQWLLPAVILCHSCGEKHRRWAQIIIILFFGLWAAGVMFFSPFSENYNHFGDLLTAKLKYANTLPQDPSVLTFDQRYLWTPELHSADWPTTRLIFPAALPAATVLAMICMALWAVKYRRYRHITGKKQIASETALLTLQVLVWAVLYIYFMRFRDMTMLFVSLLLPLSCFMLYRQWRNKVVYYTLLAVLLTTVALEWRTSRRIKRAYPQGLRYTAELIKHLRQYKLEGKTVLSDMQNSSYLKGYTDASILIQPKYELPAVRSLTQEYILTFFNGSLDEFAVFCGKNNVDYLLIHVPSITTPGNIPYSYRYISNTAKLRKDSAAVQLGLTNNFQKHFYEFDLPREVRNINGYRMYKFISPEAVKRSDRLTQRALAACKKGQNKRAANLIIKAYKLAPGPANKAYEAYCIIMRNPPPPLTPPLAEKE